MKSLISRCLKSLLLLSLCILLLPGMAVLLPADVQAFGSLTENGTAQFMGIGVNPTKILHVSGTGPGTVPLFQRGSDSAGFIIERTPTNRWVLGVNENPALGNGFVLSTIPTGNTSVPRLMITEDGNVGIGTKSPSNGKLEVLTNTGSGYAVYAENTAYENNGRLGGTAEGVCGYGTEYGVAGYSNSGYAIYGQSINYSGYFVGKVNVTDNLSVGNNVNVTGIVTATKMAYSAPRTHYYSVAPAAFTPANPTILYSKGYGGGGVYVTNVGSEGIAALVAPVNVPDGAVVTEFRVYFYDYSDDNLTVSLLRHALWGGGNETMASVSSTGISGYDSASDTSIDHDAMDNQSYGCYVWADWPAAHDDYLRIEGVRIAYTINEAE